MPQVLLNGVPMKSSELDGDVFEEALVTGIMRMTATLQKAVQNVSGNRRNESQNCLVMPYILIVPFHEEIKRLIKKPELTNHKFYLSCPRIMLVSLIKNC